MSNFFYNAIRKMKVGGRTEKAILLYLANCVGPNGCYPTQQTIATECELSLRTVKRVLQKLEAASLIHRETRSRGGRVIGTSYHLCPNGARETPSNGVIKGIEGHSMVTLTTIDGVTVSPRTKKNVNRNKDNGPKKENANLKIVLCGLIDRLGVKTLPRPKDWEKAILWAEANDFSAHDFLEVYDLCSAQMWRSAPVSAKVVADNLPRLDQLRTAVNGENYGSNQKANSKRPTAAETIRSRDYYTQAPDIA